MKIIKIKHKNNKIKILKSRCENKVSDFLFKKSFNFEFYIYFYLTCGRLLLLFFYRKIRFPIGRGGLEVSPSYHRCGHKRPQVLGHFRLRCRCHWIQAPSSRRCSAEVLEGNQQLLLPLPTTWLLRHQRS